MAVAPDETTKKARVFVHVGPHKTGTSSIQRYFHHADLEGYDTKFLNNENTYAAAQAIANRRYGLARDRLSAVKLDIEKVDAKRILISHEDFSGDLPGRREGGVPYQQLARNLQLISRTLGPYRTYFIFFLRPEADWRVSCYKQNVRYRPKYHCFDDFCADIELMSWTQTLAEAKSVIGERLITIDYNISPLSGVASILSAMDIPAFIDDQDGEYLRRNTSISDQEMFVYERINQRAFIRSLIPTYKARASAYLLSDRPLISVGAADGEYRWPRRFASPNRFVGLEKLTDRVRRRVGDQLDQPDLLPDDDFDIPAAATRTMPKDSPLPSVGRGRMPDQYEILKYHLRGASELAFINALAISYLRRNTPHTQRARSIFHRIWDSAGLFLAPELSTRWIISTLQTFMDHPANAAQAAVGAAGFFYGNLLKIYEGERSIEGLEADAAYSSRKPQTNGGFRGLDRYEVGSTDLLLNTNAAALELAASDTTAGLVLEELLLRTKHSSTVFQRFDKTRKEMRIDQHPFSDVWPFFEEQ